MNDRLHSTGTSAQSSDAAASPSSPAADSIRLIHPHDLWRPLWSPEGWRCIVALCEKRAYPEFFRNDEDMAEAENYVLRMDQQSTVHVYHANATFRAAGKPQDRERSAHQGLLA